MSSRNRYWIFLIAWAPALWTGSLAAMTVPQEDSLKQAIRLLEEQIKAQPENPALYLRVGYLYLRDEKWGRATNAFEKTLSLTDTSAYAYNGLGLAYHGKGEGIFIPVERIKQLFKIDNYSKAEKYFKRAVEINPDFIAPLYNMGVNYLNQAGEENYRKSVDALRIVLARDSLYEEAGLMLGNAYRHLKEYDAAEAQYKAVIASQRMVGKALFRLSEIYLDTGRNEDATTAYYDGIVEIKDPAMWEEIFTELEPLMTDEEKNEFKQSTVDERGTFIRKFWKKRDPTPSTPENERFIEHFRRVKYALESFPDLIPPYYDDRGKVYVKYGLPDARHVSELYFENIYRNESWSYEKTIQKGLTFDFVQKGNSFRLAQDLTEASPAGLSMANRRLLAQSLYTERSDFTDSYQRFSRGEIDNNLIDFHAERAEALKKAPSESYRFKLEGKELPFIYNMAQFRGAEGKSRTEIYIGVSSSQLSFSGGGSGGPAYSLVDYMIVLQDSNYEDVIRRVRSLKLEIESQQSMANRLFLCQENVESAEGPHFLTLHLKNMQSRSQGFYTHPYEVRSFQGDDLTLSDIQLASEIIPASGEGEFVKSGLQVMPYPYTVIRRSTPISVYFEIYNLHFDPSGQARFTVNYQIKLVGKKGSLLSRTFGAVGRIFQRKAELGISSAYKQTSQQSWGPQYITLDMGKLQPGIAEFTVTVQDENARRKASGSILFQLIE